MDSRLRGLLVEDELEGILEIATVDMDLVVVLSHGCLLEERLLRTDEGRSSDVGVEVEVVRSLRSLLKTPYLVVHVGEDEAGYFAVNGGGLMNCWHGCQVEHLTKHEVDVIEVICRDQVAAVVGIGVDVDGDVGDGQASGPPVVEEGDRC